MKNGRTNGRSKARSAELRRIQLELKGLQLQLQKAEKKAQIRMERQFEKLHDRRDQLAARFKVLKRAGESAWKDLRRGFHVSWNDLKKSVHQATARF
jgi:hypothetical protein